MGRTEGVRPFLGKKWRKEGEPREPPTVSPSLLPSLHRKKLLVYRLNHICKSCSLASLEVRQSRKLNTSPQRASLLGQCYSFSNSGCPCGDNLRKKVREGAQFRRAFKGGDQGRIVLL